MLKMMESLISDFTIDNEQTKEQELFTRDALGTITSELFTNFASFHGIPMHCDSKNFTLLSVFVKDNNNHFSYIGHLGNKGGILRDMDLATQLRPHLHRSIKANIDQYLTAIKHPFTRKITELTSRKLTQNERPEGKSFSWIDMGMTQIHYVDKDKLTAKLHDCVVDVHQECLRNVEYLYIVYKTCCSDRLHYYGSMPYQCQYWLGKDLNAINSQIQNITKSTPCLCYDDEQPRAFSFCKVLISKNGCLDVPNYNVNLIPSNPYVQSSDRSSFIAEELDFNFVSSTIDKLRSMKTKETLQLALKDIYVNLTSHQDRLEVLSFLQKVTRKFQTEENQVIQMVDLSFAVPCVPSCLEAHPTILSRTLRAAGIILNEASSQDSDDEEQPQPQIVFQPVNCQDYLRLIEALLTILVKGVITDNQCESATQLLDHEVASLQELFHTQMCCICVPWKSMNPKEEPMVTLWRKGSRTKKFLESLGLHEETIEDQKVVLCPERTHLINVLSIFFNDVE